MDWQISVKLVSFILSKPVKFDWAAVSTDSEIIAIEAIDIRNVVSGLLKMVVAMKLARNRERRDKTSPIVTLNIKPAAIMSWMFSSLPMAL